MMSSKKYSAFSFSQIGASHCKTGKECQDASLAFHGYDYAAAIVCDGHGGDKHFRSGVGARLAVEAGRDAIQQFVSEKRRFRQNISEEEISHLGKSIILSWRMKVAGHICENPFSVAEQKILSPNIPFDQERNGLTAYGTTFLAAILCREYLCLLQLGDGDIRVFSEKGCIVPMPPDNRLQFGATTSLCDLDAYANLRTRAINIKGIKGCWLSSDGIKNSFCDEKDFIAFIRMVKKEYREKNFLVFSKEIKDFLPALTKRGSGDDLSIAYITG